MTCLCLFLTVIVSQTKQVFLAVRVSARQRRVPHPGGYGEGVRQVVRENRLGDHRGGRLAVELEHLLSVATWKEMNVKTLKRPVVKTWNGT